MKRITTFATMMFIALASVVSLTSCEDEMIADSLEGTWKGDMYISSRYNGNTYNSTYTEIEFLLDPFKFTTGSGYWVDYYSDAPWDYIANHIDWRVDNGQIAIYFREEGTTIYINHYRLTNNHFTGEIYDNGKSVEFSLVHTSSPNWNDNSWYWGYDDWGYGDYYSDYNGYYDGYGYAKKGTTAVSGSRATTDSTTVTAERPHRFVRTK